MRSQIEIDTLFTEANPRAYGYRMHAEDDFGYMNRHADAPVLAAREILEGWLTRFPAVHRRDLVGRFRSRKQKQHDGAFWELYLHELFRRMGYSVQVHPKLSDIETHPDFLLLREGLPVAFVEARLAGLPTDQMTSAKQLEGELHDALDRVRSPNFFLVLDEIRTAPGRPTFKHLTRDVERWLETLNPDLPIETFRDKTEAGFRFEWEDKGWYLCLKVIPKSPGHRGRRGSRSVGISGGGDFHWVDARSELRRALREKARKYGNNSLPLVVAINYMGAYCDKEDWVDALYGSQAVNVWLTGSQVLRQEPFRNGDGFWIREGKSRQTHVSAIIAGWYVSPWSMGAHLLEVYEHPSADHAIDLDGNLPCWYVPTGKDELVMRPGRSSAEILGIPKIWPGSWNSEQVSLPPAEH